MRTGGVLALTETGTSEAQSGAVMGVAKCDVVVVAPNDDLHARAVIDHLKRRGAAVALASFRELTAKDTVSVHGERGYTFALRIGGTHLDFAQIKSIWWRRPENPVRQPFASAEAWFKYQEWQSLLFSLEAASSCNWINRPSAAWLAKRKVLQMAIAAKLGMRAPVTLITNDPLQVQEFRQRFSGTIYKSMGETAHENTVTRLLTDADVDRLDTLSNCPAIFQEFIPAKFDVRVTVVGDHVFAARIDSQRGESPLDWRYDYSVRFDLFTLEPQIQSLLVALMRELGLRYGAIDLRETPDGEYVFLEVNPAGQYLFVELLTGAPISEAMADELWRFGN